MTCTIQFTGLNPKRPKNTNNFLFISWQQRVMKPQNQVEYTTRLGGKSLIISNIKTESPVSNVVAVMRSNKVILKEAIEQLEAIAQTFRDNIGVRFSWIDDNGIVTERCYIVNMTYNIKAYDGPSIALAEYNFQIMTDLA